jgi:phosphatidylglycerophosphate synthase
MPTGSPALQSSLLSLAILAFLAAALSAFAAGCALRGRPRSPDLESRGPSLLFARWLQEFWIWLWGPVERACIRLGISPNAISFASLIVVGGAAVCLAQGALSAGGWLYLLGASLDIVDGRVARATGRSSRAGAFLDSTLDRLSELAVFAGLSAWFQGSPILFAALAAGAFSILVSYARARGEALGAPDAAKVGAMQRPERIFLTGASCALSPLADWLLGPGAGQTAVGVGLAVLAVLTAGSATRRIWAVFRALQASEPQVASRSTGPQVALKAAGPQVKQAPMRLLGPGQRRGVIR